MKPKITVRWVSGRRVRITATRGAVTTEATLTEAEANQLAAKLGKVPNGSLGPAQGGTSMTGPDIQYFAASGIWHKPPGAVRVDCLICGAGGGGAVWLVPGNPAADGEPGELRAASFPAGEIPDTMTVEIGRGGRGGQAGGVKAGDGADGYALIVTHLEQP